jgi:hypothetical protein
VEHAAGRLVDLVVEEDGGVTSWTAEHDGYVRLSPPAVHRRTVRLDRDGRRIAIEDRVTGDGSHACRLAFHLGPQVRADLRGATARLSWTGGAAVMQLPETLAWRACQGSTDPVAGWYSPAFGRKEPATTLVGTGACAPGDEPLLTALRFDAPQTG